MTKPEEEKMYGIPLQGCVRFALRFIVNNIANSFDVLTGAVPFSPVREMARAVEIATAGGFDERIALSKQLQELGYIAPPDALGFPTHATCFVLSILSAVGGV
jgi:hypothetical protein